MKQTFLVSCLYCYHWHTKGYWFSHQDSVILQIPLRIICNLILLWLGDTCFCLNFLSEHWFIFLLVQFFYQNIYSDRKESSDSSFDLHKSSLRCPFSRSTWLLEVWKFCCFLAAYWEWEILSRSNKHKKMPAHLLSHCFYL